MACRLCAKGQDAGPTVTAAPMRTTLVSLPPPLTVITCPPHRMAAHAIKRCVRCALGPRMRTVGLGLQLALHV